MEFGTRHDTTDTARQLVTDLLATQRESRQLATDLLQRNWCNGFCP